MKGGEGMYGKESYRELIVDSVLCLGNFRGGHKNMQLELKNR